MRIKESELRILISEKISRIISEASSTGGRPASAGELADIDVSEIKALYNIARSEVLKDIENPGAARQSFKQRLDKKLSELDLKTLSRDDIVSIDEYISDITIEFYVPSSKRSAPLAYWDPGKKQIVFNILSARTKNPLLNIFSQRSKEEVSSTLYHELFHAVTDVIEDIVSNKRGKHMPLSDIYKKEFDTIIHFSALNEPDTWMYLAKTSGNHALRQFALRHFGHLSDQRQKEDLALMKSSDHYYVALKQLRRMFPVNTVTRACNASASEFSKMSHWTKMLIPALSCSPLSDEAFEKVASILSDPAVKTV
jgi:hypothetical protein